VGKVQSRDRELADLADRQHGVVALWQLLERGFGRATVHRWLARGRLHPVHRGVYAVGHRRLDWRGVLMAAVLACGPDAVLSHRAAARLWGIRPDNRPKVDVTVVSRGARSRKGIQVHGVRSLDPRDITKIDGIPVTTLPRTLLDLAEVVTKDHVLKALTEAERQQIIDLGALNELLERSPGRRGRKILRGVLADTVIEPHTREEFEHRFLQLVLDAGLPMPQVNTLVEGYEVDVVWPKHKLIVELDSWEFHRHRAAFEGDRERDAVLALAGYLPIRVTWRQLTKDPAKVVERLRRFLNMR
jgi:predicted transcriptional regulator of viral defense system